MKKRVVLSEIKSGKIYIIDRVTGRDDRFINKLQSLGFTSGTSIRRTMEGLNDPIVFSIRNITVALRKMEADHILVYSSEN